MFSLLCIGFMGALALNAENSYGRLHISAKDKDNALDGLLQGIYIYAGTFVLSLCMIGYSRMKGPRPEEAARRPLLTGNSPRMQ